jgi:3D-(3,5/4)-trihydroxycyclohexane-1,2-dione acylhydrolase (decyclizing)
MAFGCINNLQMGSGMGSFGTEFRSRTETGLNGKLVPIDFAKNAEAYGCVTYSVKTEEELIAAIEDSKKQTVSTLIDIKVLPKTMTHGYEAWWRYGSAEVAEKEEIVELTNQDKKELAKARHY